jgi:predicted secreted protein
MTTSSAWWVYGSKLQLGDGATPEVFTNIAEVKDITPPQMIRDSNEVTNLDSTNGWKEFKSGFRDGGDVTFDCNWLPTDSTQDDTTGLLSTFEDDECHNWRIVLADSLGTIAFSGFITAYNGAMPMAATGNLSITIKVTGEVTGP